MLIIVSFFFARLGDKMLISLLMSAEDTIEESFELSGHGIQKLWNEFGLKSYYDFKMSPQLKKKLF